MGVVTGVDERPLGQLEGLGRTADMELDLGKPCLRHEPIPPVARESFAQARLGSDEVAAGVPGSPAERHRSRTDADIRRRGAGTIDGGVGEPFGAVVVTRVVRHPSGDLQRRRVADDGDRLLGDHGGVVQTPGCHQHLGQLGTSGVLAAVECRPQVLGGGLQVAASGRRVGGLDEGLAGDLEVTAQAGVNGEGERLAASSLPERARRLAMQPGHAGGARRSRQHLADDLVAESETGATFDEDSRVQRGLEVTEHLGGRLPQDGGQQVDVDVDAEDRRRLHRRSDVAPECVERAADRFVDVGWRRPLRGRGDRQGEQRVAGAACVDRRHLPGTGQRRDEFGEVGGCHRADAHAERTLEPIPEARDRDDEERHRPAAQPGDELSRRRIGTMGVVENQHGWRPGAVGPDDRVEHLPVPRHAGLGRGRPCVPGVTVRVPRAAVAAAGRVPARPSPRERPDHLHSPRSR